MVDLYAIQAAAPLAKGGAAEVGGKAWNLMRMARIGLPTPAAFVLPTTWRRRPQPAHAAALRTALARGVAGLEAANGLTFGAARRPLLVSVRSGAAVSMPGMMETVLDVGLNADSVEGLITLTGNPSLAWDSYRRLVQGYAEVVADQPAGPFEALTLAMVEREDVGTARDLDHRALRTLTLAMLDCYRALIGADFPSDSHEQLFHAAAAVFRSWDAPKAESYRRLNGISDDAGTAVTVQTMVFGNAGGHSGSGVGFTRDPATGDKDLYFDFQFNAQGEDVVSGRHNVRDNARLPEILPAVWARLNTVRKDLETTFRDAQDFEFTVQDETLFLLQTRRAKRTDWAALVMVVAMVEEGLITQAEALERLEGMDLKTVMRTRFDRPETEALAMATIAGIGVAIGAIALDAAAVARLADAGAPALLVRQNTETTDIEGMAKAVGILTGSGGRTSHAAVVARQLGKVCLVGCPGLRIDLEHRQCRIGAAVLAEGDVLSLDGNTGAVYAGRLKVVSERPTAALATIAKWRGAKAP